MSGERCMVRLWDCWEYYRELHGLLYSSTAGSCTAYIIYSSIIGSCILSDGQTAGSIIGSCTAYEGIKLSSLNPKP